MEKTIVPMSKEDSELVEMYFYRYNAYAELLNYLMKNTIIKENQEVFNQKWDEATILYGQLERVKQEIEQKYHPEGQWSNYTFNFLHHCLEYEPV